MTRRRLLLALAALVALAVAFLWGRTTAPATYLETVKVMRVEKSKEVRAESIRADVATETSARVVTRTRSIRRPDGTVDVRTETARERGTASAVHAAQATVEYRDREVIKTVDKLKIIEAPRPSWHVAALVGLSASPALQAGATVSRRVAGPITVGAWAVTNPREWKNATAGVSLGMEW